jgi:hypothetical protein
LKKIWAVIIIGLLCFSMFSILASQAEATSLPPVGYWKFDEGSGNTASDSSGNGNDGTIYGASWTSGISSGALRFDGADDHVNVPNSASLAVSGNQISVGLWMKPAVTLDATTPLTLLLDKGDEYGFQMDPTSSGGRIWFFVWLASAPWQGITTTTDRWEANTWYYLIGTYDGSYLRVYVNGVLENSRPLSGDLYRSGFPLSIGSYCLGTMCFFNGAIDEVKIHNYARTAEEIQADFNANAGPVGYWKFDEGSGNIAYDSSGNGNTGTVNGAGWTTGISDDALLFDGVNDYVGIADSPSLRLTTNQASLELWFKPTVTLDSTLTHRINILDKGDGYGFQMEPGARIFFTVWIGGNQWLGTVTSNWIAGKWYHIAGTYDGTTEKVYVNGILENSQSISGSLSGNSLPLSIGSYCYGTMNFFPGAIDEVKIYNCGRTAEEIWNDYISANQPPVSDFRFRGPETSFTRSTIYVGSEVKFDAEPSYDTDGTIVSYAWDFGDGITITESNRVVNHAYPISGSYTVTLTVTDDKGATGQISNELFIHPLQWELFIEIDYITGHEPTAEVLTYIEKYYRDNGINIVLHKDDEVSDPTPDDGVITENDFWTIENQWNRVFLEDDRAFGDKRNAKFNLGEKWVLFGTVDGIPEHKDWSGYTGLPSSPLGPWPGVSDTGGNYVFIADEYNDRRASYLGVTAEKTEAVVLMHELGHTIGILKLKWDWSQWRKYVEDIRGRPSWSVMSTLSQTNCNAEPIRYSQADWNLRDMEYYEI